MEDTVARFPRLRTDLAVLALVFLIYACGSLQAQVIDKTTLTGKIMCGYQGWFCCPGDGNPYWFDWFHWNNSAGSYNVDVWPATAEYASEDLFVRPNTTLTGGGAARLFSSSRQGATNVHFRWMQENGIDGVFAQRFVCNPTDAGMLTHLDLVLQNEMNAAATYGRAWALEYDISGLPDANILDWLSTDWTHLCNAFDIKNHSRYLYHSGKPVVIIWGMGFNDTGHPATSTTAQSVITWFKNNGCFVIGGVPGKWRTLDGDSRSGTAWRDVYRAFDGVTPWTVGRYKNASEITTWKSRVVSDISECNSRSQLYMPTAWPRFGWDNMMNEPCGSTKVAPPRGGQHFWDQLYAWKSAGATCQFVAMFDEYDESTAIMKLTDDVPTTGCWYTTEGKGEDWYLRLANWASKMQRGEISASGTIPVSSATSPDNAQILSDTIPTTMVALQEYAVSVTIKNTGETCWNAELFKLGGIGESDPFASARQLMLPGTTVMPNGQYTFTFMMTAPAAPDTYTTDWQMVHEIIRWFGGSLSKQITVTSGPDTIAPRPVTDLTAIPGEGSVSLSWKNSPSPDSTATMIRYRTDTYPVSATDGALCIDKPGSPGADDTYAHTGLMSGATYYYSAFAHDVVPNYSSSVTVTALTPPDTTPPVSSTDKTSGAYKLPLTLHLTASEPATIYYTTDGTDPGPSSAEYSSGIAITADTTLKFYAVDTVGNSESPKHTEIYKIVTADGSIAAVKKQAANSAVRLGDKYLYWKSGTLGYIEEPDRTSAIRVYCASLPDPAKVCLTGILKRVSAYEYRIDVDAIAPSGPMTLRPVAVAVSSARAVAMGAMCLRVWGMVKPGSVVGSTFVLLDGSVNSGLTVDTTYASGGPVTGGDFVTITGARAFSGSSPILYALQIARY